MADRGIVFGGSNESLQSRAEDETTNRGREAPEYRGRSSSRGGEAPENRGRSPSRRCETPEN